MKELIIDRSKWRTGDNGPHKTGSGDTELLNKEGFMCCLGFECLRLQLSEQDILDVGEPCDIKDESERWEEEHTSDFAEAAIDINDDSKSTLEEKEKKLIPLFKSEGINISFINEPVL